MSEQLDKALDALKTYDWGVDPNAIKPIDEAIVTTYKDTTARTNLEAKLVAILKTEAPQAAKDVICRALRTIGTAASVPALAALLPDEKLSHMARYALERIPGPEAGQALREALAKVGAKLKVGILSSLGARGETAGVAPLQALLADADPTVVRAAALALGAIATPAANAALAAVKPGAQTQGAIGEASLRCAEMLLADGKKAAAKATYQRLLANNPPKPVAQAATHGVQVCEAK
jgi:HEAT repeat protein